MEAQKRIKHWENLYDSKDLDEVSWYQKVPTITLEFINKTALPKSAKIIDIGGGDSLLVDHLLDLGYEDISVLDISATALKKAKDRLGSLAGKVTWIHADATTFKPKERYDFWHDRATFHFLTEEVEIDSYKDSVLDALNDQGILLVGTFSEEGPEQCSGLKVKQYSEKTLAGCFQGYFTMTDCFYHDHKTPSGELQNFIFCSFRKSEKND